MTAVVYYTYVMGTQGNSTGYVPGLYFYKVDAFKEQWPKVPATLLPGTPRWTRPLSGSGRALFGFLTLGFLTYTKARSWVFRYSAA